MLNEDLYTPNYELGKYENHPDYFQISVEEARQEALAISPEWLLARCNNSDKTDTKGTLERLGFTIIAELDYFYEVKQPYGWMKKTHGYNTVVFDEKGKIRISQFYCGSPYAQQAFLIFLD